MRNSIIFPAFVMLCCWYATQSSYAAESEWTPAAHPAELERTIVGFTKPRRTLDIASEVSARIIAIHADVGARIDGTKPLVLFDDTQAVIAQKVAEAALVAAQQTTSAAELAIQAAEREAGLRERTAARTKVLADDGKISAEELDMTHTAASVAQVALEQARITHAQALTAQKQAALEVERANDFVQRHRIIAPEGWLVAKRNAEPGAMIAAGTPFMRVVDTSTLVIELYITTEELTAMRAQKNISIRFPRHNNASAPATLARLDPEFDPVSRKRRIELDVAGAEAPEAIGGLEVAVSISMPDPSGGLLIPSSFLRFAGERYSVRTNDGRDIIVTILRKQHDDHVVVLPDQLTNDVVIVP